ncbi:MAG: hypothetical protein WCS43_11855 [Verrucomicrobiota bacterium]
MKRKTLGSEIKRLRLEKEISLMQVGKKAGFCEATICHLELDRPVRWETVHLVLLLALGVRQDEPTYQEMNHLWIAGRKRHAENLPDDHNAKNLSKHAAVAVKNFREIVREMDESQINRLLSTVRRSAGQLWE